jgi:hypothetical protein
MVCGTSRKPLLLMLQLAGSRMLSFEAVCSTCSQQNPANACVRTLLLCLHAAHLLICRRPLPSCWLRSDQQLIALDDFATRFIRHVPFQLQEYG